ncbi:hypothetical protein [Marinobacterium weihaiense]|uniref:Uncharacterized protein n=1 Tax=Marinobacterium weihaiense TaxID=2851016 RepID=A0ABS6M959_9GAMM|nr:hypothetical protein [Marinobacterium weihaiense]MBV0932419.1 hypothetical protein [Marinobacterium weihaiense]
MQKWIGAGVLVAAAGAGLAWQQGWFGSSVEPMAAYVPADTVLYAGGQVDQAQVEQMRQLPLLANSQFQVKQLLDELESSSRHETPQEAFAKALLRDFLGNANTYGDMVDHYGLDLARPQAVYMDGMVPVLRFGLKDETRFWNVLEQASADSGLTAREISLGDTSVKLWRLTPENEDSLELAINVRNGVATLTAFHFLDQDTDKQARMALIKPARSLADSGELDQLQTAYDFQNGMLALVHLERLAQGFLTPDSNGFGQDLKALMSAKDESLPTARMDEACRTEVLSLVSQVPRMVAGNTAQSATATTSRTVLEIKNADVVEALASLRGHIPGHTAPSEQQLLGLGVGLNVDNLIPAATTLLNKAKATPSQCKELQRLQRQLGNANPAMAGMFTGMVQGTQGAGFSLYNIDFEGERGLPKNLDFLFSIATSNPQPLLGMLSMSPIGRQLQIPTDGTLTDVDLSFAVPGLSLKAGLQGDHLVAFTGEQAGTAAEALKQESLDANGLVRLGANYGRFADLIDALPGEVAREMDTGYGRHDGCVNRAKLSQMLRSQGAGMDYRFDIIEQGLSTDVQISLDGSSQASINPVGRYHVTGTSYDCSIDDNAFAEDDIRADNTGSYRYLEGGCARFRSEYTWSQEGNVFSTQTTKAESRQSCEDNWTPSGELEATGCAMLPAEKGFRCIYSDDDGEKLLHYVPRS